MSEMTWEFSRESSPVAIGRRFVQGFAAYDIAKILFERTNIPAFRLRHDGHGALTLWLTNERFREEVTDLVTLYIPVTFKTKILCDDWRGDGEDPGGRAKTPGPAVRTII